MFEDAEVSPESLASDESRNVREDEIGVNPKEVEAVLLELMFGGEFFLDGCFVGVYAVINDADVLRLEFRREEPQFIGDESADGENGVAVFGGVNEGIFEVQVLVAEDVFDVEFLLVSFFDDVVKHCVVAGVVLDDFAHRRDFVGVEDSFIIARLVENSGQGGGHTHILVGDNDGFVGGGANGFEDGQCGWCEADILFEFPEVFVEVAADFEFFKKLGFEIVDCACVGVADIEEDDFRGGFDACLGIDEGSSAVDDADVVEGFDFGKGGGVAGVEKSVDGGIKDFTVVAEAVEDRAVGCEKRADEDGAVTASRYDRQVKKPSRTAPMPPILAAASCVI